MKCSKNKNLNGEHYNLYTDGLIIHTTIDSKIQKHTELFRKEKNGRTTRKIL